MQIAFPLPPIARVTHDAVVENLRALGLRAVVAGGTPSTIWTSCPPRLDLTAATELLVVVDRLTPTPADAGRLAEAIATAFAEGEGIAVALVDEQPAPLHRVPRLQRCDTPAPS